MPSGIYTRTEHQKNLLRIRLNKVRYKAYTLESRRKISEANRISLLGNIPWNKGKKGFIKFSEAKKKKHSIMAKEKGFGKWMLNKIGADANSWKGGLPSCLECGVQLKVRNTKFQHCKKCYSKKFRTGAKNPNWKGGVTDVNMKMRHSLEYKLWRTNVFERDNYTCQKCGQRGVKLEADHILPFSFFPEMRFELFNGKTLCKECHKNTITYGKRGKKLFQSLGLLDKNNNLMF